MGGLPCRCWNLVTSIDLAYGVVCIDRHKGQETPTSGCLSKGLERRKKPLLFWSALRMRDKKRSTENRLAEALQRLRESLIAGRIGRRCIEDHVIQD